MRSVRAEGKRTIAPLGRRITAELIEWVLVTPAFILVLGQLLQMAGVDDWRRMSIRSGWMLGVPYTFVMVAVLGATIGKLVMAVRVETYDRGELPGWRRAGLRVAVFTALPLSLIGVVVPAMSEALAFFAMVWSLIVVVSVLADTERRGLHDKAAGTVVVRR